MTKLLHILLYKFTGFIKFDNNKSVLKIIQNIGSILVYSSFGIGAYLFSYNVIEFLMVEVKIGLFLLHQFIAMILFIFFIAVNVGNIIVSYSTLFKSQEVSFYYTKPVNPIQIFIIKFLDNFFYSSGTLIMAILALLAGYYSYFKPNLFELLFIILFNFIPYLISAASLGVILLLVILKAASKLGMKPVLFLLTTAYLSIMTFFFNANAPIDLVNNVMAYYPNVDIYFGFLLSDTVKMLPNNWLAESFYWMLNGKFHFSISYTILQVSLSTLLFSAAIVTGNLWYKKLWQNIDSYWRKKSKTKSHSILNMAELFSTKIEMIIKKDLLLFFRDSSQVIHLFILLFLIILFSTSVKSLAYLTGSNYELRAILVLVILIFNSLLISTLALRFIFPIISLEGKSFWKIKSSPINIYKFLFAKFSPSIILISFIGLVLTFYSLRKFNSNLVFVAILLNFLVTIIIISINVGLGGLFANYKEKNPIRIASSQGASLSFLLSILIIVIMSAICYNSILVSFDGHFFGKGANWNQFLLPISVLSAISLIVAPSSILLLIKSLKRDY